MVSQAKSGSFPAAINVMPMLPNTQYALPAWINTVNVPSIAAFVDIRGHTGARIPITTTPTSKVGGMTD